MTTTLCDLSNRLPRLIGSLLDRETLLKKGRFREETMTDLFTGALAAFAGPDLVIEYPPEAKTGADVDIQFWHAASGRDVYLRLQAKRLNAQVEGERTIKVSHRSYRELLHKPNPEAEYQFETLSGAPRSIVPLYMFYNHNSVVNDPYFSTTGPKVAGINLAFAFDIAREMSDKVDAAAGSPKRVLHHKRLSHLRPHLFGLDAILCPSAPDAGEIVPTPDAVAASLTTRWRDSRRSTVGLGDSEWMLRALSEPPSYGIGRDRLPPLRDGPSVRVSSRLERPRITFISGRTTDERTPKITDDSPYQTD